MNRAFIAVLLLFVAAFPSSSAAAGKPRPPLILISIDGFRAEYLDRGLTPTLTALAEGGVRAEAMRPSFPVNTFPNHYTLVTGLRPDRHGIVDNTMNDPARPGVTFAMKARDQVEDRFWWDGGEPIWVAAERQGRRTATMYWPGSEAPVHGLRPSTWFRYDVTVPAETRVDRLLGWFDLPPADRPAFMTLYFESVDSIGHHSGPESPELEAALKAVDAALKRLVDGLAARGLGDKVNIVVVSDHGMAAVSPERIAYLDDVAPPESYRLVTGGSMVSLVPVDAQAEARLVGRHGHFECWRKAQLPARFHYGSHPRIPPVVCLAETGWYVTTRSRQAEKPMSKPGGGHGFDPADPRMAAIFVARGPGFRRGVVLKPFDNVSVYPLLARLLGIKPAANDGSLQDTRAALR